MPCSKMVKSLESLSVVSVAENLGKVEWYKHFTEDEGNPGYFLSPFDVLPPSMLTAVIRAVMWTMGTTRQEDHLGLLITKKLEKLNLTSLSFPKLTESTALHLLSSAALIHSPLKKLYFSFKQTPYHKLQSILPAFPNLQVLDVSWTSCVNDNFMSLFASCCTQLKSLCLADCSLVTDDGIQRLCNPSNSPAGGGICSSLVKLDIQRTKVTRHGARLALEHLTKLEELEWGWTVQVVVEMHRSGERRPLALKRLDLNCEYQGLAFEENSLATAIQLCPLAVFFYLNENYETSSLDMRALLQLDRLQGLILRNASRISFDEDLLPVLQKFGHKSLEHLDICNISEMNLGAIVEHCSMLRCFFTYDMERFTQSRRPMEHSHRHLPSLQRIEIQAFGDRGRVPFSVQPSSADLSLLLNSAPALIDLKLELLDNLTDGIFEQAIVQHGFPHLKELHVSACPNVTRNVVDLMLELDNPLSSIQIERFKHYWDSSHDQSEVVDGKYPAWKKKIARNNLDVEIHYCECDD